jgi:2-iminobutanoate/2-iminopropanoate deaminase
MTKKTYTPEGVVAVGPYSPIVEANGLIFFSGQIPMDYAENKIVEGGIQAQTEQCLKNLAGALNAANVTADDIVKTTIYLTDMNDYALVNKIYGDFFKAPYPARTAIAVAALPLGVKIEIEAIAQRI